MNPFVNAVAQGVYAMVLFGNIVSIIVCLIAGPRTWSRDLSIICLWVTGLFAPVAAYGAYESVWMIQPTEGAIVPIVWQGHMDGLFALIAFIPLAIEFLLLLAVVRWRLRPTVPGVA